MAVPMASLAKEGALRGFKRRVASFRVAGMAVCDPATRVTTWRKLLCVTGAILFQGSQKISEDNLPASWQAHHFGDLRHDFAWQVQRFRRVLLHAFGGWQCVKW